MTVANPVVLGIDPGYDRLGWAVGTQNQQRKINFNEYGCITTNTKAAIYDRFGQIISELTTIIKKHQPTELAIETIFFSKNKTTAMRVAELRGVVTCLALQNGLTVTEYGPPQIKSAVTGNGNANKAAVIKMVELQTGLSLKTELDDTVDAMATVITHLASRQIRAISKT